MQQYLWVQAAVSRVDLRVAKVGMSENPADMLTKFLSAETVTPRMSVTSSLRQLPSAEGERQSGRVFRARSSLQELRKASGHRQGARALDHEPTIFKEAQRQCCVFGLSDGATSVRGRVDRFLCAW